MKSLLEKLSALDIMCNCPLWPKRENISPDDVVCICILYRLHGDRLEKFGVQGGMKHAIWRVSPVDYGHSGAFDSVCLGLSGAFRDLGYSCPVLPYASDEGRNIVIGGNLIRDVREVPDDAIIYNLEQVSSGSTWFTEEYLSLLRTHEVWDYSQRNIDSLKELGIDARLLEIGYHPSMERVSPETEPIDVLFYGSVNPRRMYVIEQLSQKGLTIRTVFGIYGDELDILIAKSKVVLNLHYYDSKVWEIVRCSYLLANRKCVVSEIGSDASMEIPFVQGVAFAAYDDLVSMCMAYVNDAVLRREKAELGYEIFRGRKQSDFLKRVL